MKLRASHLRRLIREAIAEMAPEAQPQQAPTYGTAGVTSSQNGKSVTNYLVLRSMDGGTTWADPKGAPYAGKVDVVTDPKYVAAYAAAFEPPAPPAQSELGPAATDPSYGRPVDTSREGT